MSMGVGRVAPSISPVGRRAVIRASGCPLEGRRPEALITAVVHTGNIEGATRRTPILIPNHLARRKFPRDWVRLVLPSPRAQAARVVAVSLKEAAMERVGSTPG